jgi:DNA-binding response OmpR family regulator
MKILLVDEDVSVREALGQALAFDEFQVVPVANRQQALDEFQCHHIDLLLLDLNPASEDAWETIACFTALRPSLPVIALTARPEQHEQVSTRQVRVLPKPLDLPFLVRTLKDLGPTHNSTIRSLSPVAGSLSLLNSPTQNAVPVSFHQ